MPYILDNDPPKDNQSVIKRGIVVAADNIQNFPSLELVGLSLRKPTQGAEYKMVSKYIQSKLLEPEPGQPKIIFL